MLSHNNSNITYCTQWSWTSTGISVSNFVVSAGSESHIKVSGLHTQRWQQYRKPGILSRCSTVMH